MELVPCRHSGWQLLPPPSLTPHQKFWLSRPGALTAGLRRLGQVDLRVVREKAEGLHSEESWMLARPPGSGIWLREICMAIDGADSVFARSFTPLAASHALWQGMRRLRTRPLADMLYHDSQITRSRFFTSRLHRQHPVYRAMQKHLGADCPAATSVLARCSIFWRLDQPLMVAEAFLPAFWEIAGTCRP